MTLASDLTRGLAKSYIGPNRPSKHNSVGVGLFLHAGLDSLEQLLQERSGKLELFILKYRRP
jgi:hypothetical protein